jgi:hypothetical protein
VAPRLEDVHLVPIKVGERRAGALLLVDPAGRFDARKLLTGPTARRHILTEPGVGYRFLSDAFE